MLDRTRREIVTAMLAAFVAASLFCVFASAEDSVTTRFGVMHGEVSLSGNSLSVSGKKFLWKDVIFMSLAERGSRFPEPNYVRFRNGEVWAVTALSAEKRKMQVRSSLFGERRIYTRLVSSLDFVPDFNLPAGSGGGVLFRKGGNRLAGEILWMSDSAIGIESPLGALSINREECESYVFNEPYDKVKEEDEVVFADGSRIFGEVSIVDGRIRIEHSSLKELNFNLPAVRAVVKRTDKVVYLSRLTPKSDKAQSVIGGADSGRAVLGIDRSGKFMNGVCADWINIACPGEVAYELPEKAGGNMIISSTLAAASGVEAKMHVIVAVDGKTVWNGDVAPGQKPIEMKAKVGGGKNISIEVRHKDKLLFPASVMFGDLFVGPEFEKIKPPAPKVEKKDPAPAEAKAGGADVKAGGETEKKPEPPK
ncbi:MAG: hypothetical protein JXR97_11445 [Planctomycetes bacterium]|nr:hypothetical protein [Planctomycetota bacterium]